MKRDLAVAVGGTIVPRDLEAVLQGFVSVLRMLEPKIPLERLR